MNTEPDRVFSCIQQKQIGLKEEEKRFIDSRLSNLQTCQVAAEPGMGMTRSEELWAMPSHGQDHTTGCTCSFYSMGTIFCS